MATDTVWADEPAVDDGSMAAQVFVGRNNYATDVYGCKMDAEFAGILEDNIHLRGAMVCLVSDGAKSEISAKVVNILGMYKCCNYMSEPEHQHQNLAEIGSGRLKIPRTESWTCLLYTSDAADE